MPHYPAAFQLVLCFLFIFCSYETLSKEQARELQAGVIYKGGERIRVSALGLSFTLPQNWQGTLSPDGESFVMEQQGGDAKLVVLAQQMTKQQLSSTLGQPIVLQGALQLVPTRQASVDESTVQAEYSVSYYSAYSAKVIAKSFDDKVAIAFFLIEAKANPHPQNFIPSLIEGVAYSEQENPQTSASAPETTQSNKDDWQTYLKGKHIVRFYTASGYTEEQHIWLCSDGRFARKFDSGGFGGGASGAFSGQYGGRWQASGAGEHGTLILRFNSGDYSEYQLRWDYEKNRLYVDGKRWLHSENQLCY